MTNIEILLSIILVIIMFLLIKCNLTTEPFNSKPNNIEINKKISQMIIHRDSFEQDMYTAREKMPWMDAIIYEDARSRLRNNQFNYNGLKQIFN